MKPRNTIIKVLFEVTQNQRSMSLLLSEMLSPETDSRDRGFIKDACFGVLRWYYRLKCIESELLHTPLKQKDNDISCLILLGLYQLLFSDTPDYAVVSEAVSTCKDLKKPWASSLVNKILREFIRNKKSILEKIDKEQTCLFAHPAWFVARLKKAWPNQWEAILKANNQKPPLTLRVNQQKTSRDDFLNLLKTKNILAKPLEALANGITLDQPIPIKDIPSFEDGFCSVQDASGQFAATLLDLKAGQRVLDACAAPGSKTSHILETESKLSKLVIMDKDAERFKKVKENILRLGLDHSFTQLVLADAAHTRLWWDGEPFDRILLDAPCSATGVIRRHPDIKLLRKDSDIDRQAQLQMLLLLALWKLLKPKGKLLYSTCSVLPEENEQIISSFLAHNNNAKLASIELPCGVKRKAGWQILPSENGPDGFYYCLLTKN